MHERTTYANASADNLDVTSNAGLSVTSYVASIVDESNEETLHFPDPPEESADGKDFECPYCYILQSIKTKKQ